HHVAGRIAESAEDLVWTVQPEANAVGTKACVLEHPADLALAQAPAITGEEFRAQGITSTALERLVIQPPGQVPGPLRSAERSAYNAPEDFFWSVEFFKT